VGEFGQSTLENWQSEYLRLFSFMVVSAVLIHHSSCETKDATERTERAVAEVRTMQRNAGLPSGRPVDGAPSCSRTGPVPGRTCSMSG